MKNILFSFLILFFAHSAMAKTSTVTLSTDNVTSPTVGMLRYYINNAVAGDIINFSVDKVNLEGELSISDKSLLIDGSSIGIVTIDGAAKGRIFNITLYSSSTTITVKNIILQNGKVDKSMAWGGALYLYMPWGGNVEFNNCSFINNMAVASSDGQGGAVRCDGGLFKNCQFINNAVTGTTNTRMGGAVTALGGAFINCLFSGNSANYGGGIYVSGDAFFYNCTLTQNQCTSADEGGGIFCDQTAAQLVNCISYNNLANGVTNNIVRYNNGGTFKNCAMELGNALAGTNGNIGLTISPFIGGAGADMFELNSSTSCINAGTISGITVLTTDIAGKARIQGSAIDMGAYEYGISTGNNFVEINDHCLLYPNITSGVIYINQTFVENDESMIQILDATGKIVVPKCKMSGMNSVDLSGHKGIYLAVVSNGIKTFTQKILVR
jgi:predicted outer membrane repeat protein